MGWDGIEIGLFSRRVKPEEDPDVARKEYSAQDGAGRESEGDSGAMHNHLGSR